MIIALSTVSTPFSIIIYRWFSFNNFVAFGLMQFFQSVKNAKHSKKFRHQFVKNDFFVGQIQLEIGDFPLKKAAHFGFVLDLWFG